MNPEGRPRVGLPSVPSVTLGDVTLGSHSLTKQAERLESVCARIGRRLDYWLRRTMRDTMKTHGSEIEAPLPSEEFLEAFRYWQAALLGLLKEQRERAVLQGDQPSPEQLQAQFAEELKRGLDSFNEAERAFAMRIWNTNAAELAPTTETPQ